MGGPRKDFFVRNPVWNRNCEANCTPKRDSSSAADVCVECLPVCETIEENKIVKLTILSLRVDGILQLTSFLMKLKNSTEKILRECKNRIF